MITFLLFTIITMVLIVAALALLSVGGSLFVLMAADFIVAAGIIWLIYGAFKKKKK